ncbi:MAG: hypothetical protein ABR587_08250 [Candidatus Binatia bacterium]
MKITRSCSTVLLALALGLGFSACDRRDGPAENVGEEIDDAAGDVRAAGREANEEMKEAARDVERKVD